jgi:phenylacetate-CoA ligase
MKRVAHCDPEQREAWQLAKLQTTMVHHRRIGGAYAAMLQSVGIGPEWELRSLEDLSAVPTIDKEFLRDHRYHEQPATDLPVTIVTTSGTTSLATYIPHNEESLRSGLGDNFVRAFVAAGISEHERFWLTGHWDISEHEFSLGATGSFLSMYWLQELLGESVLLHNSQLDVSDALRLAVAFRPTVIASSPNLLTRLAQAALEWKWKPNVEAVLYGGAAATDEHRATWNEVFSPSKVIAFYPTTDAGAIGVSSNDDGVYETFTETHFVEILDGSGNAVEVGQRGHLVVTSYASMAAPLVRYKVGDIVTFEGFHQGRVQVSGIRRERDIVIGDALLPLSVVEGWSEKAHAKGYAVRAIQLVCRSTKLGKDLLIIRLIDTETPEDLERWLRGALVEIPQLRVSLAGGEVVGPVFEIAERDAFDDKFKIPAFVDERPRH